MVRQSHPIVLLTRPLAQSQRFAAEIGGAVISPLMTPEYLSPAIPERDFAAVILTSETGVEAARRISAKGRALPNRAFCVGNRTANAARAAGFDVVSANGNATDLQTLITAAKPAGPLLFLRADDVAGDLEKALVLAGIDTVSAVIYRQKAQFLTEEAVDILQGDLPVILPIFSPRSARLLAAEIRRVQGKAPFWLVAISLAAAQAFDLPTTLIQIATRPDGSAMLEAVAMLRR